MHQFYSYFHQFLNQNHNYCIVELKFYRKHSDESYDVFISEGIQLKVYPLCTASRKKKGKRVRIAVAAVCFEESARKLVEYYTLSLHQWRAEGVSAQQARSHQLS